MATPNHLTEYGQTGRSRSVIKLERGRYPKWSAAHRSPPARCDGRSLIGTSEWTVDSRQRWLHNVPVMYHACDHG